MTNHADEARRILTEGENAVKNIRESLAEGQFTNADNYGKKAMGCWAQAQVHATLAVADQLRAQMLFTFLTDSYDELSNDRREILLDEITRLVGQVEV